MLPEGCTSYALPCLFSKQNPTGVVNEKKKQRETYAGLEDIALMECRLSSTWTGEDADDALSQTKT